MKNHRKRGNRSFFFYQRVNDSSQIGFQILLEADVMEGDLSGLIDHVLCGQGGHVVSLSDFVACRDLAVSVFFQADIIHRRFPAVFLWNSCID